MPPSLEILAAGAPAISSLASSQVSARLLSIELSALMDRPTTQHPVPSSAFTKCPPL